MKSLFLLATCFMVATAESNTRTQMYKKIQEVLGKFKNEKAKVVDMIQNSKARERRDEGNSNLEKRTNDPLYLTLQDDSSVEKRTLNLKSTVYRTDVYYIPTHQLIINATFAIFGKDGVLDKGGFYLDGEIHQDGRAALTMAKSFHDRNTFINEIERARREPFKETPLSVITHLLVSKEDLDNMVAWERAKIAQGITIQYDRCAPKIVVMYFCCTRTSNLYLGPLFGTLKVGCD